MWATVRPLTSNTKLEGKVAITAILDYESPCFGYDGYEEFAVQINEFVADTLNQIGPKKGLDSAAKIVASSWLRYVATYIVCSATSSPMFVNDHVEGSIISRADIVRSINNLSRTTSLQAMGYSFARVSFWLGRKCNTDDMEAVLSPYLSELKESSVSKFSNNCLSLGEYHEARLLQCCAMSYEGTLVLFNWIRKMLTLTTNQAESRHFYFKCKILWADMMKAFGWMSLNIFNRLHFPLDAQAESNRVCDRSGIDHDRNHERKRLKKPLPNVPDEILQSHILPKLPFHSLLRFKCVSRKWKETVLCRHSQNLFLKQEGHDRIQSFGLFNRCKKTLKEVPKCGGVELVLIDTATPMNFCNSSFYASCSGFLCLELSCNEYSESRFTIGNPVTGEWNLLPPLRLDFVAAISMGPGLAVDLSKSPPGYKLVILGFGIEHKFYVFSSDTGEWKASQAMLSQFDNSIFSEELEREGNSVYINGLLYWLSEEKNLFWFDLDRDEANSIALPCSCKRSSPCVIGNLEEQGGQMRLTFTVKHDDYRLMIYGLNGKNQWGKLLSVPIISIGDFKPFPYMGGEHLLVLEGDKMLAYNLSSRRWRVLLEDHVGGLSLLFLDIFSFKMNISPLPKRINF